MRLYHLRTLSVFIILTLFLVAFGYVIGWFFGYGMYGFTIMLVISLMMSFASYFFSKQMALSANRVRIVTEAEEPRLYHIVQKVAGEAGLPMPEVGIADWNMPNAFATGRNPQNAAVVATRPLLDYLSDDELEGVIGHEMSHVKNRDILVMSVASAMVSMLTFAARMFYFSVLTGGVRSDDRNTNAVLVAVALVSLIFVPIAGLILQMAVSRNREYLADETGGRITRKPLALASALSKLEAGCANPRNDYTNTARANMWITGPERRGFLKNMFSTHPSTPDRIQRLQRLAKEMDAGTVPAYDPRETGNKSKLNYQK